MDHNPRDVARGGGVYKTAKKDNVQREKRRVWFPHSAASSLSKPGKELLTCARYVRSGAYLRNLLFFLYWPFTLNICVFLFVSALKLGGGEYALRSFFPHVFIAFRSQPTIRGSLVC